MQSDYSPYVYLYATILAFLNTGVAWARFFKPSSVAYQIDYFFIGQAVLGVALICIGAKLIPSEKDSTREDYPDRYHQASMFAWAGVLTIIIGLVHYLLIRLWEHPTPEMIDDPSIKKSTRGYIAGITTLVFFVFLFIYRYSRPKVVEAFIVFK